MLVAASKKKGSSGTPDSNTPTASGASIGIEKPAQDSTIDDVLVGDEVEALRIREEDLIKVCTCIACRLLQCGS